MHAGPIQVYRLQNIALLSNVCRLHKSHRCPLLWRAVFTFNPYLLISRIHLFISINEFLISRIHLWISINDRLVKDQRRSDDYSVQQYVTFYCTWTKLHTAGNTTIHLHTAGLDTSLCIPVHMAALRATARGSTPCDCALSNSYLSLVLPSPSIQLLYTAICPVI